MLLYASMLVSTVGLALDTGGSEALSVTQSPCPISVHRTLAVAAAVMNVA